MCYWFRISDPGSVLLGPKAGGKLSSWLLRVVRSRLMRIHEGNSIRIVLLPTCMPDLIMESNFFITTWHDALLSLLLNHSSLDDLLPRWLFFHIEVIDQCDICCSVLRSNSGRIIELWNYKFKLRTIGCSQLNTIGPWLVTCLLAPLVLS